MALAQLISLPGIKTPFAVGLSWRHVDHKPSSGELRQIALQEGQWGMLRTTALTHYQVGTCDGVEGAKSPKGIRSLAALLADHHREPWMGLYPLSDGTDGLYWYIAVRDGGEIYPGGDRVGTIDELMLIRNEHQRVGPWNEYNGTFNELLNMVEEMPMQSGMRDLTVRPWLTATYIGGLALVLILIAAAWLHYQDQQAQRAREIAQARQKAIEAAHKAKADAEARVLPWTREPQAAVLLDTCHRSWAEQALVDPISGWELADWHCNVITGGAAINRHWISDGANAANAPGRIGPLGTDSNDSRGLSLAYPTPSSLALSDDEARRAVWSFAQSYALDLKIGDDNAQTQPGETAELAAERVWQTRMADFIMDLPPWTDGVRDGFDSLPGLRVRSVDWVAQTGKWSVHATLYTLRPSLDRLPDAHKSRPIAHHHASSEAGAAAKSMSDRNQATSTVSGVSQ